MRLLLVLVFLRPALSAIMGNKPVCPGYSSVSVLNPSAEKIDPVCDLCEYLNHMDEHYSMFLLCDKLHNPLMLNKLVRDCKRITQSGSKAQLQWFSDVLSIVCREPVSEHEHRFEGPICGCDPCSELAKLDKSFMKTCAPKMTREMVSERLRICKQVKHDYEKLWFFYQNLKQECLALSGENITLSICECDVCWLLFYETSDFMAKCGRHMDQAMVNKLFASCEKIMCDPVSLMQFKKNLELVCEAKHSASFEFPQCACEECWLLFQKNSDFMHKCGFGMSDDMLKNLMENCYANLKSLDNFITFIDNLQATCQNQGKEHFKHEWCYCVDCLLYEDHEKDIWKDCISHMQESVRLTNRKECFNATLEGTLQQYKLNLFEYCNANYGCNVTFPTCKGCSRTDLAIVFAVDYSPSMRHHGYISTAAGIRVSLISQSIGENKSHFGLIRFDRYSDVMFSLRPGYFNYWSTYMWQRSHFYYRFGPGTEYAKMLKTLGSMFEYTNDTRAKYAVIITDGYNTGFTIGSLKEAASSMSEDITLLVVGLGYTDVNNLLTISTNKPQNVYNYNPRPPLDEMYLIIGDLMRNIGC